MSSAIFFSNIYIMYHVSPKQWFVRWYVEKNYSELFRETHCNEKTDGVNAIYVKNFGGVDAFIILSWTGKTEMLEVKYHSTHIFGVT